MAGEAPFRYAALSGTVPSITAAGTFYAVGNATTGVKLPGGQGGRLAELSCFSTTTVDTSGTSITVTAYKNSVNAANQCFQVTLDIDGVSDESGTTTTVVDSGMDSLGASDTLFLEYVVAGTTFTVLDFNWTLSYAVDY